MIFRWKKYQAKVDRYYRCIDAGLRELNLSIHTLDPVELGALMAPPRSSGWGQRAIYCQLALCDALESRLRLKINTCVGAHEDEALKIATFVRSRRITWRIMKVLETSEASQAAMMRLCATLGATPKSAVLVRGTSSCSILMETPDGFTFVVKLIRPLRLRSMCDACPIDAAGKCFEFAYGPRVEAVYDHLLVRNCLYRSEEPFVIDANQFAHHQIAEETYA